MNVGNGVYEWIEHREIVDYYVFLLSSAPFNISMVINFSSSEANGKVSIKPETNFNRFFGVRVLDKIRRYRESFKWLSSYFLCESFSSLCSSMEHKYVSKDFVTDTKRFCVD